MKRFVLSLTSAALLVACGAPDPGAERSPEGVSPEERSAADAEVARIQARLGEATCASTAGDVIHVVDGPEISPDAAYDHPTCRDAFIVDAPGLQAGLRVVGTSYIFQQPGGPALDPIGCFFDVAFVYLYEKRGTSYTLIDQAGAFGVLTTNRAGVTCTNSINLAVPRAGDYKVVASSFRLFGAKNRVAAIIGNYQAP